MQSDSRLFMNCSKMERTRIGLRISGLCFRKCNEPYFNMDYASKIEYVGPDRPDNIKFQKSDFIEVLGAGIAQLGMLYFGEW